MTSILIQRQRGNSLELPLLHFVNGLMKVKLALLEIHPTNACIIKRMYMTFLASILLLLRRKKSFTVELARKNKKMTLTDKSIFSNLDTLYIQWLQILALELTGKDKVLKPFWTKRCLEISQRLWLPTETDCVDLDLNSSSSSLKNVKLNSLFSIERIVNLQGQTSPMISSQSSMSTPVKKWVEEDILRSKKVRLYPTQNQREILKKWIGTTRYVYNRGLAYLKENKEEKHNFQSLRNKFVTKKDNPIVADWEIETPKDIRAGGLQDLDIAYKSAFSNLKKGNILHFDLSFRQKKKSFSLRIPKTALKLENGKFYMYKSKKFIPTPIKLSNDKFLLNLEIKHDCRLSYKDGKWFIYIPYKAEVKQKNQQEPYCALDPGIRKFQTIYSEKSVEKVYIQKELIKKIKTKINLYQSLRAKKQITKSHFQRGIRSQYFKLQNLVDDTHYKAINELTNRFKTVFIPEFESQEIVKINKSKSTRNQCLTLKHFMFKQRLIHKANLSGCDVVVCSEEFTSKTCGKCGSLNNKLGSSEIFTCSKCNLVIDRDINGARNILIKNLVSN